jgi:hypothetical protein
MNKISKIGFIIYFLNLAIIFTLVLLSKKIPDFFSKYVVWGGLIVILVGAIGNQGKSQLL